MADGRIHPARIEDMVSKAEKEVSDDIWKSGEQAVFDAGVRGLHPEIVRLLGRLKYRYSYGENVLQHCLEVGHIAGMIAAEVGGKREHRQDRRAAPRHRKGAHSRDRGAARGDRRRRIGQVRRCERCLCVHQGAPRRRDELPGVVHSSGGRRDQRCKAGLLAGTP